MPDNLQPETMSTWMRDVERRLRAMETRNRLTVQQFGAIVPPNTYAETNDPAGERLWEFRIGQVIADAVSVEFYVDEAAGETGGVRLATTTHATDELVLPVGYEGLVRFDWIVPNMTVGERSKLIYIEGRRIAGGGQLRIFVPQVVLHGQAYEFDATSTGNGRTIP